jgi:hypothetical protein
MMILIFRTPSAVPQRTRGGHSHHVLMGDQVGQAAVDQPLTAQVIEPDRDAHLVQLSERIVLVSEGMVQVS